MKKFSTLINSHFYETKMEQYHTSTAHLLHKKSIFADHKLICQLEKLTLERSI